MSVVFYSFFLRVQILLPYKRKGRASVLYTFVPAYLWAKVGLKLLFRIPSIWANFAHFCWISFAFSHSQPRYLNFCTYCKHFLYTKVHILQGSALKLPPSQIFLVIFPFQNFLLFFVIWMLLSTSGSEVHSVTYPTQTPIVICPCCSVPKLMRLWGPSHSGGTVPSYMEEMPQNMAVQRLQGGSPTTGLPSSRLVTYPRELIITFKPQCKDLHSHTLYSFNTTACPSTVSTVTAVYLSHILETGICLWLTERLLQTYRLVLRHTTEDV